MPLATLDDVRAARRLLIHGMTGSGKSTAALALGERLGLPVHLYDEEFGWLPGWTPRPDEEQRVLVAAVAAEPTWVLDTTYSRVRDLVDPDVIVGLDHPRWLSLGRLVRRTLARVLDKRPICSGNTETWRQVFSNDSILLWHFRSYARKRDTMRAWAACPEGTPVMLLKHPPGTGPPAEQPVIASGVAPLGPQEGPSPCRVAHIIPCQNDCPKGRRHHVWS